MPWWCVIVRKRKKIANQRIFWCKRITLEDGVWRLFINGTIEINSSLAMPGWWWILIIDWMTRSALIGQFSAHEAGVSIGDFRVFLWIRSKGICRVPTKNGTKSRKRIYCSCTLIISLGFMIYSTCQPSFMWNEILVPHKHFQTQFLCISWRKSLKHSGITKCPLCKLKMKPSDVASLT